MAFLSGRFPETQVFGACRRPPAGTGFLRCDFGSVASTTKLLKDVGPDHLFHCAGTTLSGPWETLIKSHVDPTFFLLEGLQSLRSKMPRVIIIGSAAEYGGQGESGGRLSEAVPPCPETPYGLSKYLQTSLALTYARRGCPVIVARLFNVFAPDSPPHFAVGRLIKALRDHPGRGARILEVGSLGAVRDFLTLNDVFEALSLIALRAKTGDVYNVCSGRGTKMGTLFKTLIKASGVLLRLVPDKIILERSSTKRCVGNPSKLFRDTGFVPQEDVKLAAQKCVRDLKSP